MPLSRKHFVAGAALGVTAAKFAQQSPAEAAAPERAPVHYHIVKPNEYNEALMMKKLSVPNRHKQVFQSVGPLVVAPGIASVYMHMQNSMNAFKYSFGSQGG